MTNAWIRRIWPLTIALSAWGLGCSGSFPDSLSFPKDNTGAPAAAPTPPPAEKMPFWPVSTTPTVPPALPPEVAETSYTWAELSARGRDAMAFGQYAAAERALLSALAQTESLEAHDVRVGTSLRNLTYLAQALDAAGLYAQSDAIIEVLIAEERENRRVYFDVAGPLMLARAQRLADEGNTVDAARVAQAALNLSGSGDPMNSQLRNQIEAILWPAPEAASEPEASTE